MPIIDTVARFMGNLAVSGMQESRELQERSLLFETTAFGDLPPVSEQARNLERYRRGRPWRKPSIADALGNPAIQRAVSLISNTTGSLTIEGFRRGVVMPETPRVLSRPDPFLTPREAYRDMAYCIATRGETVLYIAHRDFDGLADALVVVPLLELTVEENPRNRLFPIYRWGDVESTRFSPANPTGAFVHITYLKEPGELRGKGPLQLCGAAVSVTVEAQEWAANFYSDGGHASTLIKYNGDLSSVEDGEGEAANLKAQWMETDNNTPKVIDDNIESVEYTQPDVAGAQMLASREYQNGDAARMFGIPGSLLEYNTAGSSLTYQNVSEEYRKFVQACLSINYLEPIEQALSDLLSRSTVARFNVEGLLRADIKTRYDVYESAIAKSGVMTVEEARRKEGLDAGNVEVQPVPFAPPAAIPASLPMQNRALPSDIRCEKCSRLMVKEFTGSGAFKCDRCGHAWTVAA